MDNSQLIPLLFDDEHLVRYVKRGDDDIWFLAVDVCRSLGLSNVTQALSRLDEDEVSTLISNEGQSGPDRNIVSEPGAYRLVFSSRKPVAERFKRWLAHDVIPQIRKNGFYAHPDAAAIAPLSTRLRMITTMRQTFGIRAAQELWSRLNLPIVPSMRIDGPDLFTYMAVDASEGQLPN